MLATFGRMLAWGDGRVVVHECRRCGTTLDGPDATCPFGCSAGVVHYEI
ncbi:MAG: hypothetical protein ACQEQY_03455 [Halobacteriota archaeon]